MVGHLAKIKAFFLKNEQRIVTIITFLLIGAISCEFGVLQGEKWQQKPLVIEKPVDCPVADQGGQNEASETPGTKAIANSATSGGQAAQTANCAFVGSKNSAKFYALTCTWAKRIKPENMICYKSEQEAVAKGKTKSDCK